MIYYKSRIVKSKPVSYQVDGEELLKMFARTPSSDSFDRNFFSSDFFDGKIFTSNGLFSPADFYTS